MHHACTACVLQKDELIGTEPRVPSKAPLTVTTLVLETHLCGFKGRNTVPHDM